MGSLFATFNDTIFNAQQNGLKATLKSMIDTPTADVVIPKGGVVPAVLGVAPKTLSLPVRKIS
ncbi:hypothetical protein NHP190012_11020 [Helicobacter sp. NHP19-012]|uniref:Uncharacterized protein n=1 Tax=Helicobacter gastrofelis TaxID=2849642 RepID=A0ABM7SF41_9HELI|nr:hypothetical protein [Helicobacter sp. NHP22-001]BCZ19460.1 hypothetical protein NHP190012_11020 [Helicobacter sp. NHP19-012]GMB96450.1 hypothetical protein NHP22001_10390 [Helicobacter sp. NHP22-001]